MIIVGEMPSPSVDVEHKPKEIPISTHENEDSGFAEIFDKELRRDEYATQRLCADFGADKDRN